MAIFGFLKKWVTATQTEGLTQAEKEIAFGVAEVAGTVMRLQFECAARFGIGRASEAIDQSYAFAFGVLTEALRAKGISWEKSPFVSIRFTEVYMPDAKDHKTQARLIFHYGMHKEFTAFRLAGEEAFRRFAASDDSDPPPTDDLARALGFKRH
jgi:hypothetical protein